MSNTTAARHNEIADVLISEILNNRFRVGERLPSERDLAVRFAVNRGCIREAVKKLEQIGLTTVLPGGARVLPVDESSLDVIGHLLMLEDIPDTTLVDEVMEVMHSLMGLAVRRAMDRASEETISRIKQLVTVLLDPAISREKQILSHMQLASEFMHASDSLPLKLISRALRLQYLDQILDVISKPVSDQDQPLRPYLLELNDALENSDTEEVVRLMREMFEASRKILVDTLRSMKADSKAAAL